MLLTPGTRLGPYEIIAPLGAGGMGEVFRAKDTRLGRDVALKVLPQHLSANPEVRARFEREAKTVSSLNHPHICTLHDVGREGDTDYLVMELVEGETLAQRLEKGALLAAEVLKLGGQIADALDRAHRAGVIHRDLKPGNVMLTKSGAKLMDFGLARATGMAGPSGGSGVTMAALSQSPTVAAPLTAEGTILGTFQYMAPEQLEGGEADARSDLWALGCVLYEMATGKRAFEGKSQASLITSIMGSQPAPLSQLAPLSPPGLERLVHACLAKDPADRLQSAHDIRMQLAWLAEGGSQAGVAAPVAARRVSRERIAWSLVAALAVAAGALMLPRMSPKGVTSELLRFSVLPPPGASFMTASTAGSPMAANLVISPDGRLLAVVASDSGGVDRLWIRPLASLESKALPGTEGAYLPFWSPDGRALAFFANNKLNRIDLAGGSPQAICDAPAGRGGSWSKDGIIVFNPRAGGPLYRIPAAGGEMTAVTALDSTRGEAAHRFPCFLPDGRHFLYVTLPARDGNYETRVGSLDSERSAPLLKANGATIFAPPNHVLFARQGTLMAQRFDARRRRLVGDPVATGELAGSQGQFTTAPAASASRTGVIVHPIGDAPNTHLVWFGRDGRPQGTLPLPEARHVTPEFSQDGTRLAFSTRNLNRTSDIWILEIARGVSTRFTFDPSSNIYAVWSPDGTRIAFSSDRGGTRDIFVKPTSGAEPEKAILTGGLFKDPCAWSPDGKLLVYRAHDPKTQYDLWRIATSGEGEPTRFLATPYNESAAAISPDGRWIAYLSDESGRVEVYAQSFPEPGSKQRVSTAGAAEGMLAWTRGGNEILYVSGEARSVVAVPIRASASLAIGAPEVLFDLPDGVQSATVSRDGERFLISMASSGERLSPLTVVLNWTRALSR